jgi:hypothetical protein
MQVDRKARRRWIKGEVKMEGLTFKTGNTACAEVKQWPKDVKRLG